AWLLPAAIYVLTAALCAQVVLSRPGPAAELRAAVEVEFSPRIEEYIREGTVSREQGEWLRLFVLPGTPHFLAIQSAGTLAAATLTMLAISLVLWQLARSVLGRRIPYRKALEVAGLTFVIGAVERVATAVLVIATGTIFASPGPSLLLLGEKEGTAFLLLSSLNVFTFWQIYAAASGLAALTERDFPKVLVLLAALWVLWTLLGAAPLVVAGS
ncbi:MAG: hypothetical protein WB626_03200, partial [Bacteroidota bacterium]